MIENSKLAMTIATVFDDPQLSGVTKGKPIDLVAQGLQDQIDWFNLPYVSKTQPTGTEAWQQKTVKSQEVKVLYVTNEQAMVQVIGASTEDPDISVVTTYTIKPGQEWISAETVLTNTYGQSKKVWIGDAMDYDGAGQRSVVPGNGIITTPYSDTQAFTPAQPWVGMTGNDGQVFGLIYTGTLNGFTTYGNGNWIMSQMNVELPAGGSFVLKRGIVAVPGSDSGEPLEVLARLYGQFTQ